MPFPIAQIREALSRHQPTLVAREPDHAEAAVALVLAGPEDDLSLCAIRRAEHPLDPWSGHMALPGGRASAEDSGPRAVAERETLEEVGLALDEVALDRPALARPGQPRCRRRPDGPLPVRLLPGRGARPLRHQRRGGRGVLDPALPSLGPAQRRAASNGSAATPSSSTRRSAFAIPTSGGSPSASSPSSRTSSTPRSPSGRSPRPTMSGDRLDAVVVGAGISGLTRPSGSPAACGSPCWKRRSAPAGPSRPSRTEPGASRWGPTPSSRTTRASAG